MQIGMVGLGKMGANMSARLVEKGHEVVAFDLSAEARAVFNVRFNDCWTGDRLTAWLRQRLAETDLDMRHTLDVTVSGEAFLVPPGVVGASLAEAIRRVTGRSPEFSTTGGTSDARFIQAYCPVAEFGLVGETMHKIDERVDVADLVRLTEIYRTFLDLYFARS